MGNNSTFNNSSSGTVINVYNNSNAYINNSGNIYLVSNTGSIGTIGNIGTIGTIINSGSIGNINNSGTIRTVSNRGKITNINITNSGSIGTISNTNIINSIVTGKGSSATINNAGLVNNIFTGGAIKVNNTGLINNISIGSNGVLDGNNSGYVVNVTTMHGGKSTSQWTTTSEATILQMQNQFILNHLLTREEQSAGVGVSRIGGTLYRDISDPVANALARDVWEFEERRGGNFAANNLWFAGMTGDEGRWNLKYLDPETNKRRWETTLGISFWGYRTPMVLNGMIEEVEDVGNITYGNLGTAIGFTQGWLNFWSAANHTKNHQWRNWENELEDQANIAIGINWYTNR